MSATTKDWWVRFFADSGVPLFASTSYAVLFDNNRIQSNMLLDLNENNLKDIGITVVGDRITILKHARNVYKERYYKNYYSHINQKARTEKIKNEINELTKLLEPVKKIPNSDDNDTTSPTKLKTKSSIFYRSGAGYVSSSTSSIDSIKTSSTDSKKLLQTKQTGKSSTGVTLKRAVKRGNDTFYGPSFPTGKSSTLTKKIKMEEMNSSSSESTIECLGSPCDLEETMITSANCRGTPIYLIKKKKCVP